MSQVTQLVRIARKVPTPAVRVSHWHFSACLLHWSGSLGSLSFHFPVPISPTYAASYFPTCWVSLKVKQLRIGDLQFHCWLWASWTQVTQQGAWAAAVVLPAHLCPSFFLDEISVPLLNSSTCLWSQEPTHFLSSVMDMLQWFFLFSSIHQLFSPLTHFTSIFSSTPLTSLHPTSLSFTAKVLIMFDPDAGKDWRQEEKMVGGHHWLNGLEFEQTSGDSEGQGSPACYSSWGRRLRHNWATEQQQQMFVWSLCLQSLSYPSL